MASKPNGSRNEGPFGTFNAFFPKSLDGHFTGRAFHSVWNPVLDFAKLRLRHTEDAIEECKNCGTPTAFLHAQQQWLSQMMRDYLEQGNDATAKLRSAASDEVASVKRHARQDGNRDTA